jgi:hypothetical protein
MLHLGAGFGWCSTGRQHLNNFVGDQFAGCDYLFVTRWPSENFANFVE